MVSQAPTDELEKRLVNQSPFSVSGLEGCAVS